MEITPIGFEEIKWFEEEIKMPFYPIIKEKREMAEGEIWIKREKTKKDMPSILIFFSLPQLGQISVRIAEYNGSLSCIIKSKNKETSQLLKKNLPELTEGLNKFCPPYKQIKCIFQK